MARLHQHMDNIDIRRQFAQYSILNEHEVKSRIDVIEKLLHCKINEKREKCEAIFRFSLPENGIMF